MTSPRIYTYKVTFEEVPHWYWGVHKEKKYREVYLGSSETHKWMWDFYTPRVQILEFFPYTNEGWKEANTVEKRLIRPDLNNPLCLNENVGGLMSLDSSRRGGKKTHEDKTVGGKSVHAIVTNKIIHSEKNKEGKSVAALRAAYSLHEEKNEQGKSKHAVKAVNALHAAKNSEGKSVQAVKGAQEVNKQVWESKIDGYMGSPASVALHNKRRGWDPDARVRIS